MKTCSFKVLIASLVILTFAASNGFAQPDTLDIFGAQASQLGPGVYHAISDIWVAEGQTLTIANETDIVFDGNYGFDIHGTLTTFGGLNGIEFKPYTPGNYWRGIRFTPTANQLSILAGCLITGSDENGIYIDSCGVTIESCTITENSSDGDGGGIYVLDCSPIITNCEISNNSCDDNGAGIYLENSNPDMYECLVTGNAAQGNGGGIYANNSHPNIGGGEFTDNTADGDGGGLYFDDSNPTLSSVKINGNRADNIGGGIYITFGADPTFDPIDLCDIWENYAGCGSDFYTGGVTYFDVPLDTFTVANPTEFHAYPLLFFSINPVYSTVLQEDADLYVSPSGDDGNSGLNALNPLRNISYALSKIIAGQSNPHTIYLADGEYTYSQSGTIFPLNMVSYASMAGPDGSEQDAILNGENETMVMYFHGDHDITCENLTVTESVEYYGAAVYCYISMASFANCHITQNNWTGMHFVGSETEISYCTISENDHSGLYFEVDCIANISHCEINANSGASWGAGIYMTDGCEGVIEYCTIMDNSASSMGGGICLKDTCSPDIYQCTIQYNTSGEYGGGISCSDLSDPYISYCDIQHNICSTWFGGGISVLTNSNPTIERCVICNNSADAGGGIGIGDWDIASAEIYYCTVARNEATTGCQLYANQDSDPFIVNTSFEAYNQASYTVHLDGCPNADISYCNIFNDNWNYLVGGNGPPTGLGVMVGVTGAGDSLDTYNNVYADPLFADPVAGSYLLGSGSPCIDAGDPGYPSEPGDAGLPDIGRYWAGWVAGVQKDNGIEQPKEFSLQQNYPNPFNPKTTISYGLPMAGEVQLTVFDISGRLVSELVNGWRDIGVHEVMFEASDLASGLYIYHLDAGDFTASGKMILMK
ncbi:hypothetical protein CEE37_03940 [candidate division LCP-89 bacterium B3_LCP]|uniref:Secretion system C-terminal sorting domain-containing protein n=1 Tax=candidate division LCP-89 bacterium B3_LCP TaxID=2012998 RepID=A0A532V3K5_UNCL8|nr:MAG: hypothetical protein CEE37_03940 [candidate division LCP-89 bacterium B3_LCP]